MIYDGDDDTEGGEIILLVEEQRERGFVGVGQDSAASLPTHISSSSSSSS